MSNNTNACGVKKPLVIVGAGDFGRETAWVVERMNERGDSWELLGFVDDDPNVLGTMPGGYPVLGTISWFENQIQKLWAVCSIGKGSVRRYVTDKVFKRPNIVPAVLVDPAVIIGRDAKIGAGSIICAGSILAVNSVLEEHVILNFNCTVGHDTVLETCCTVHPGCSISGKVRVERCTDIGTGTKIIQGVSIAPETILGAGAVVIDNITTSGTYVGVPARRAK